MRGCNRSSIIELVWAIASRRLRRCKLQPATPTSRAAINGWSKTDDDDEGDRQQFGPSSSGGVALMVVVR